MSQAYIGAIRAHCPHATLVLDGFRVVKALNAAIDEVRLWSASPRASCR